MMFFSFSSWSTVTSPVFAFCLMCQFLGKMAQATNQKVSSFHHQESGFLSADVGESLTLQCFYEKDYSTGIYWYKQSLGQKPKLISTLYVFSKNGTFHDKFQNNTRFTLDTETGKNHLKITDLCTSDSATYYCARGISLNIEFATGMFVSVKASGLNIQTLVHRSASESDQPGDSVTLNCTVHTGTCDGEHSVYWFKTSEESQPGLIYTHGGRNDQCERKPDTQTQTCVYNLPVKSLDLSHAGTYYCAVASCGHILFGDGTKLDFEVDVDSLVLVYFLSGALTFTITLTVLLAFFTCVISKRNNCKCTESRTRFSATSTTNAEGDQNEENIHYAALWEHKGKRSRRQMDNTKTECVYSSIKQENCTVVSV